MAKDEYGPDAEGEKPAKKKVFDEFDCPLCNANNPYGDGFKAGDEVRCYYCGAEFKVRVDDNNKLRLKEL